MDSTTRLPRIESLFLSRFLNLASVPSSEIGEKLRRRKGRRGVQLIEKVASSTHTICMFISMHVRWLKIYFSQDMVSFLIGEWKNQLQDNIIELDVC